MTNSAAVVLFFAICAIGIVIAWRVALGSWAQSLAPFRELGPLATPARVSHIRTHPLRCLLEPVAKQKANPWSPVALTARGGPWGEFGLHQAFRRVLKRAKLTAWTVYSLRHFFVTELFRRRAPAPVVQRLAGHSDLATTQRYADIDASDLRAAIALFDGNDVETAQ